MSSTPFTNRFINNALDAIRIRGTNISIDRQKRDTLNRRLLSLAARARPSLDFTPYENPSPSRAIRREAIELADDAGLAEEIVTFAGLDVVPLPARPTPTCLVLSGGGFKGSYEVGFLKYFERLWDDFNVEAIMGTSVGAVNAVALAQEGKAGIERLTELWLGLSRDADMYTQHSGLENVDQILEPLFGKGIEELIEGLMESGGFSGLEKAVLSYFEDELILTGSGLATLFVGAATGGPIGLMMVGLGMLLGGLGADQIGGSLTDLKGHLMSAFETLLELPSIYEFGPLEATLTEQLQGKPLDAPGTPILRLAMVQLEDGSIYYFTEDLKLMKGHPKSDKAEQIWGLSVNQDPTDVIVQAVLASSSPPLLFPPVPIVELGSSNQVVNKAQFVDGGIREMLPLRAAFEMDYKRIISILTSPPLVPEWQSSDASPTLAEVLLRTLPIILDEIVDNDLAESLRRADVELMSSCPRVEVFPDAFNVDPGLIRINIAYGYMQGWAATLTAAGKDDLDWWEKAVVPTVMDEIIETRKRVWILEQAAQRVPHPSQPPTDPLGYWDPLLLNEIRELKQKVMEWTEILYQIDPDAVPLWLRPSDWWRKFEHHKGPLGFKLNNIQPFECLTIVPSQGQGLAHPESTGSVPPRPESQIPALK